jgi:hypothetical protein
MKTTVYILSMLTVFAISGFGQKSNTPELLENKNTRSEIFNTIMNDHELMMDFISAMKNNQHAMMMMKGSNMMGHDEDMGHEGNMAHGHQMMEHGQQTMDHAQMMQMLKNDPALMEDMMGVMMERCEQDSTFCNNLAEKMTEHPGMMQMGMHKMKEKGMMGPDGELIIPESRTERMGHNLKH